MFVERREKVPVEGIEAGLAVSTVIGKVPVTIRVSASTRRWREMPGASDKEVVWRPPTARVLDSGRACGVIALGHDSGGPESV